MRCCGWRARLQALVDRGDTVVVIEHNLDVIAAADCVIDLGPEGGEHGGRIVAWGAPETVAASRQSRTAPFLRQALASRSGRGHTRSSPRKSTVSESPPNWTT
jgi:hypothetical protein